MQNPPLEEIRIEITRRCNSSCAYCYVDKSSQKESAILDELVLQSFVSEAMDLGLKTVSFTGGEPLLLYPHISSLIKWTKTFGVDVGLLTNASLLSPILADNLKSSGLNWARISIDAPPGNKDVVAYHRRDSSCVPHAIEMLQSRDIEVILRATVSSYNAHCLPQLIEFANLSRVNRLELQPYFPFGDSQTDDNFLMSPELHISTADMILQLRRGLADQFNIVLYSGWFEFLSSEYKGESVQTSRCGRRFLFLDALGRIKTCGPSHRLLGKANASCKSLKEIWYSNEYLNHIRNPSPLGICCDCSWFNLCRFWCPATNTVFRIAPNAPVPICPKVRLWNDRRVNCDVREKGEVL